MAIAIASLAIGVTYATAQRGLNQTISARERNQALNLIQNQITQLQLAFQSDPAGFASKYGSPNNHFCLNGTNPYQNTKAGNFGNLQPQPGGPYHPNCIDSSSGVGTTFFYDIVTIPRSPTIPTTFHVFVRWEPVGGSQINQASVYFRPNGTTTQILNYVNPGSLSKQYAFRRASNDA